jgi:putative nucleotidyltransferase with HDIG domain
MLKRNKSDYRLMIIDDDEHFLLGIEGVLKYKEKYDIKSFSNHDEAIAVLKKKKGDYDLLILDYMLNGATAKEVVKQIREFDKEIYILLLTAKADAPPIETMQELNIQDYCEKNSQTYENDMLLAIYSGLTAVDMMTTIRTVRNGFKKMLTSMADVNGFRPIDTLTDIIINHILDLVGCKDMFLLIDKEVLEGGELIKGTGKYNVQHEKNELINSVESLKKIGEARLRENEDVAILDNSIFVKIVDINESKDIGYMWLDFNYVDIKNADNESIIELLKVYANQAALTITNSLAHVKTNNQKIAIEMQNKELKDHIRSVVDALRIAIDNKDEYTRGHSDRVAEYATMMGKQLGFNKHNQSILQMAGWFHDVGKIGISDDILLKPDVLTAEEYERVKKHPEDGVKILSAISAFKDVINIVRDHHERLDGSGYPRGLFEDEIDTMTRIMSVADSFDAMTSGRAYKKNMSITDAVEDLLLKSKIEYKDEPRKMADGRLAAYWYDKDIVNLFIKALVYERYLKIENAQFQEGERKLFQSTTPMVLVSNSSWVD